MYFEKRQLQEQPLKENKKTKFTVAFKGGFSRELLLGLILVICGVVTLFWVSRIQLNGLNTAKLLVTYVRENALHSLLVMLASVAIIIGLLIICVRLIRKIVLIPRWIVVHFKRLFR